jgi:hypothetical protein
MLVAAALLLIAAGALLLPQTIGDGRGQRDVAADDVPSIPGPPPVVATPSSIHLGTLEPNTTVTRSIELQNTGDEPLRILAARSSCRCTTVQARQWSIPARGIASVTAVFDSEARPGGKYVTVHVWIAGYDEPVSVPITAEVLAGGL